MLQVLLAGHIAGHGAGLAALGDNALHDRRGRLQAQVADHHGRTGRRKGFGDRTAYARTRARDDGHLVVEPEMTRVIHRGLLKGLAFAALRPCAACAV
ncbi:hypothetical protein D3C78_1756530 [compost metagenome]